MKARNRIILWSLCLGYLLMTPTWSEASDFTPVTYEDAKGKTMPYQILHPEAAQPGQRYPLVMFFHGAGERGNDNRVQLKHGTSLFLEPKHRAEFPCFVVAPQCPQGQQWVDMPWGDDFGSRPSEPSQAMQLALGILDELVESLPVDTNRIYVTGLSMGGYATWDCVTRFPGRFAAGAPICGGGDENTVTKSVAQVPVWVFHSDDDRVVKVGRSRRMVKAMRDAGGQPRYFEYFGLGHFSWGQAYGEPELLPWMFAQQLGKPDAYVLKTKAPELPDVARWPEPDSLFPGQGPLQKADWFQKLWRQKRLSWWRAREKDHGAVVFLGDSITQGWGRLAKDFPGYKVANRGISGDVTRGVRFRLKEDVLDLDPAAVVLLIGTNDLGLGGNPDDAADNVKALLDSLESHNSKMPVIVCKVMPRQANYADHIQRLNQMVDAAMKGRPQFISCDTWSLFADEKGVPKKSEFPDLLHPNKIGYDKWAEALQPILAKLPLKR